MVDDHHDNRQTLIDRRNALRNRQSTHDERIRRQVQ